MNLQLHHVISDITGQTGLTIVDAILAGERDPLELAKLCNGKAGQKRPGCFRVGLPKAPRPSETYQRKYVAFLKKNQT
jgi:hypothetical protein